MCKSVYLSIGYLARYYERSEVMAPFSAAGRSRRQVEGMVQGLPEQMITVPLPLPGDVRNLRIKARGGARAEWNGAYAARIRAPRLRDA